MSSYRGCRCRLSGTDEINFATITAEKIDVPRMTKTQVLCEKKTRSEFSLSTMTLDRAPADGEKLTIAIRSCEKIRN